MGGKRGSSLAARTAAWSRASPSGTVWPRKPQQERSCPPRFRLTNAPYTVQSAVSPSRPVQRLGHALRCARPPPRGGPPPRIPAAPAPGQLGPGGWRTRCTVRGGGVRGPRPPAPARCRCRRRQDASATRRRPGKMPVPPVTRHRCGRNRRSAPACRRPPQSPGASSNRPAIAAPQWPQRPLANLVLARSDSRRARSPLGRSPGSRSLGRRDRTTLPV